MGDEQVRAVAIALSMMAEVGSAANTMRYVVTQIADNEARLIHSSA